MPYVWVTGWMDFPSKQSTNWDISQDITKASYVTQLCSNSAAICSFDTPRIVRT